jgi:hypothetical protein
MGTLPRLPAHRGDQRGPHWRQLSHLSFALNRPRGALSSAVLAYELSLEQVLHALKLRRNGRRIGQWLL